MARGPRRLALRGQGEQEKVHDPKALVVKVAQTRKPGRKSWKVEVTLHDLDKGERTHLVRVDVDDNFLDECGPNGVAERMGQNMEEAVIRALRAVLPGKKVEVAWYQDD